VFFGKLLARDTNFFKLFNPHSDHIVEEAHAFSKLVANYSNLPLREKYHREVNQAEGVVLENS